MEEIVVLLTTNPLLVHIIQGGMAQFKVTQACSFQNPVMSAVDTALM